MSNETLVVNERCPLFKDCRENGLNGDVGCTWIGMEDQCPFFSYYAMNTPAAAGSSDAAAFQKKSEPVPSGDIVYLPVDELYPHPCNPRKELGDLTELADSIKTNGVLQNLTVVPRTEGDGYTIVIGHRRHAAAKLAGLATVPCVISNMGDQQQLGTMLLENIQRSDLSVYEQAQGFQLMLDLGETVDSVAEMTGFSTSTVRRRIKLLSLDKDKFETASQRGATLFDFAELDKLDSLELKNSVLEKIGTPDFKNVLKAAVSQEAKLKYIDETVIPCMESFATEIRSDDIKGCELVKTWFWSDKSPVDIPDDADSQEYFFHIGQDHKSVSLLRKRSKAGVDEGDEEDDDDKRAKTVARMGALYNEVREINSRHCELRVDFGRSLSERALKDKVDLLIKYILTQVFTRDNPVQAYSAAEFQAFIDVLGIPATAPGKLDIPTLEEQCKDSPYRCIFALAMYFSCSNRLSFYRSSVDKESGIYYIEHKDSKELCKLYELLGALGYQESEEEQLMRTGMHQVFQESEKLLTAFHDSSSAGM